MHRLVVIAVAGFVSACSGGMASPAAPSQQVASQVPPMSGPSGVLSGVVVDSVSGMPLAGVNVNWAGLAEAWGDRGDGVMTNANGQYQMTISAPGAGLTGMINVLATKTGYVDQVVMINVMGPTTLNLKLVAAAQVPGP